VGRYDLALEDYLRAAQSAPGDAEVMSNLGTTLHNLNRHHEALAVLDAAIAHVPNHALAHYNAALVLLHLGAFRRGWQEYEWRWGTPFFAPAGPRLRSAAVARRSHRGPHHPCCTPSRDLAIPSNFFATFRWSPDAVPMSSSKCRANWQT
jgi:tetratricopeptide (TPR) repeat protein